MCINDLYCVVFLFKEEQPFRSRSTGTGRNKTFFFFKFILLVSDSEWPEHHLLSLSIMKKLKGYNWIFFLMK